MSTWMKIHTFKQEQLDVAFSAIKKKKLTWGPPVSYFFYFLGYHLQDQPLFQKKKIDRGPPTEGFLKGY